MFIVANEIGYIENTVENRRMLNLNLEIENSASELCETDIREQTEKDWLENHEETWSENDVKRLIAFYEDDLDKFRNPKIKKKDLWRNIANKMEGKTAESCDKKFRNLKQHYVFVKKKKKSTGRGAMRWPYYTALERLFQTDTNINPERELNIIQTLPTIEPNIEKHLQDHNHQQENSRRKQLIQDQQHENQVPKQNETRKRKRNEDIRKLLAQSGTRQVNIEKKIDTLLKLVEQSNNIQQERNEILKEYVAKNKK